MPSGPSRSAYVGRTAERASLARGGPLGTSFVMGVGVRGLMLLAELALVAHGPRALLAAGWREERGRACNSRGPRARPSTLHSSHRAGHGPSRRTPWRTGVDGAPSGGVEPRRAGTRSTALRMTVSRRGARTPSGTGRPRCARASRAVWSSRSSAIVLAG
eukprot:CAMPEP_0119407262 /NCGR_PEP_ID=MMETSP1335-20130426/1229_1 /TAXON_ID=259385 /ORGANISM="Chrysoculter rhomboideus, Strain RCC1486" /LENGTH=159 /DNA_ID=CAMNT_0007431359 /DNA_START=274 /DNA_END=749 /DNA_ORIENTATION=-